MEHRIVKRFQNLSLSSSSQPREEQFQRTLSVPLCPAVEEAPEETFHKIRISLSSRFLRQLNEVATIMATVAREMDLMVWGPGKLLSQVVNITTSCLTPSPLGDNLVRNSELQYYGRVIDVIGSIELVEEVISGFGAFRVDIEYKVIDF